jgi:hypothetical protein
MRHALAYFSGIQAFFLRSFHSSDVNGAGMIQVGVDRNVQAFYPAGYFKSMKNSWPD